MKAWIAARLDRDAPLWRHLWSVQLSILTAVLAGVWAALPAFQALMPPVVFALVCVGCSLLILVARLTHQKGFPDDA